MAHVHPDPCSQVLEFNALPLAINEARSLSSLRSLSEAEEHTVDLWEEPPDPLLPAG